MVLAKSLIALIVAASFCGTIELRAQEVPPPLPAEELGPSTAAAAIVAQEASTDDFEIQTRGPIHEAFAEIYQADPQPGLLISKRPPKAIEEAPPTIKLDGKDVVWIPGYWTWDDENQDFLWISGIWRKPPPGMEWAPGYWAEVAGGFRWVSGFWARNGEKIVVRQQPPEARAQQEILDAAPEDQFWVPGTWQWQNDQYAWSDGYYAPCQSNWVWVPARWKWTPPGYIHLTGYWDYRPTVRAMLFAPVRFQPNVLLRPNLVFTPRVVVDPWIAINHFWIRPYYCHYYFGNYYADNYAQWGFQPYGIYFRTAGNWDPLLSYYQGFYRRQGIDFQARLVSGNSYYVANAGLRPPLNWNAQRTFSVEHRGEASAQNSIITSPIVDFVASAQSRIPLVTIDDRVRFALGKADTRMTQQILAHRELAERAKIDPAAADKVSDLVNWSIPKLERKRDSNDLRMTGAKLDPAVAGDLADRPSPRKQANAAPRADKEPNIVRNPPETKPNAPNEVDAKKAALKADMDILRARFGNDPVRFQQEVDRLMSRRAGEPPATSLRNRSPTPDPGSGSSLQGSGRSGGLGSPDFRLLPRSGGGASPTPRR